MKKLIYAIAFLSGMLPAWGADAQFAAQSNAVYMATLKAVVDIKIEDEEIASDVQQLRENQRFLADLQRRLGRLQNTRTKNADNRRIFEILLQAGRDIDSILR